MSAFKWTALGHREIADMITSLICHGTLTRFPKLRLASVENGSAWIKPLFDDLQSTYNKMPQNFPEHPHEVFRRNCWVSPFWEGSVADVVQTVGWDKVMFGSDWPHPEGLAEPKGYWKYAEGMDSGAPTTSWVTTPGASWGCRSPTPIRTPSSRRRWRTPDGRLAWRELNDLDRKSCRTPSTTPGVDADTQCRQREPIVPGVLPE